MFRTSKIVAEREIRRCVAVAADDRGDDPTVTDPGGEWVAMPTQARWHLHYSPCPSGCSSPIADDDTYFVMECRLCEGTGYVLDGTPKEIRTMRVPDVSFIATGNLPEETPTGC